MFLFGMLLSLIVTASSTSYTVGNITITLTSISNGTVYTTNSSVDQCKKMIGRSGQLFHLSKEGAYQSWPNGNLVT
jgi:hypothetical protein